MLSPVDIEEVIANIDTPDIITMIISIASIDLFFRYCPIVKAKT